jgi:hypothetical protein
MKSNQAKGKANGNVIARPALVARNAIVMANVMGAMRMPSMILCGRRSQVARPSGGLASFG